jgi:hypothetical protein
MSPDRLEGDGFKVGSNPFSHPDYQAVRRAWKLNTFRRSYSSTRDVAYRSIEN